MKFTVILPIHNEAEMLPLTLRSIYAIQPQEVLFGLDRCTDNSEAIIKAEARNHPSVDTKIKHYKENDGLGWGFRSAFLRRDLYFDAKNDIILNTSADIRLCPTIENKLTLIPKKYSLISFHYYEKPWNIQCFERAIITKFFPGFAGLLALSKKAWLLTEDLEDLKRIPRGEDTHLQLAIKSRFHTKHIHTRSLHLRPNEEKQDHYNRGQAMYQQLHRTPFTVFIHSLVMFRPAAFTGYMHARSLDHNR